MNNTIINNSITIENIDFSLANHQTRNCLTIQKEEILGNKKSNRKIDKEDLKVGDILWIPIKQFSKMFNIFADRSKSKKIKKFTKETIRQHKEQGKLRRPVVVIYVDENLGSIIVNPTFSLKSHNKNNGTYFNDEKGEYIIAPYALKMSKEEYWLEKPTKRMSKELLNKHLSQWEIENEWNETFKDYKNILNKLESRAEEAKKEQEEKKRKLKHLQRSEEVDYYE